MMNRPQQPAYQSDYHARITDAPHSPDFLRVFDAMPRVESKILYLITSLYK